MSGGNQEQEEEVEGLGMNARVKEFLFPSRTAPVRSTTTSTPKPLSTVSCTSIFSPATRCTVPTAPSKEITGMSG